MTAVCVESIERSRRAICDVGEDSGTTAALLGDVVWVSSGGRDECVVQAAVGYVFDEQQQTALLSRDVRVDIIRTKSCWAFLYFFFTSASPPRVGAWLPFLS